MDGSMLPNSGLPAWHKGEIALQRHAGVAGRMAEIGSRVLRPLLIEQHRNFYPLLPFVVLGAVDKAGDVWATLRAGHPGFLASPDPLHLNVAMPRESSDPADAGMEDGDMVGLLGIDLHTRRRNRLNGRIERQDGTGFAIAVEQSYGNCPQYIQQRSFAFHREPGTPAPLPARHLDRLDARARAMITGSAGFFVATYVTREDGHAQVDVSHRGGRPGFVRVDADGTLTVPDFAGNRFFNTLGNMLVNPRAGLVFIDFAMGDLLQLTGEAQVVLDDPEIMEIDGAERLWRFRPRQVVYRPQALPLHWDFDEATGWSPEALANGVWERS
ncbi:MAG TPA: pyridoxamine 5'-phosphate oxidase family protein [Stellaceae bacterium]|nr:pyridoxamine 5'-phosphate oxidase family protein [Stellaceae bacterium]